MLHTSGSPCFSCLKFLRTGAFDRAPIALQDGFGVSGHASPFQRSRAYFTSVLARTDFQLLKIGRFPQPRFPQPRRTELMSDAVPRRGCSAVSSSGASEERERAGLHGTRRFHRQRNDPRNSRGHFRLAAEAQQRVSELLENGIRSRRSRRRTAELDAFVVLEHILRHCQLAISVKRSYDNRARPHDETSSA